MKKLIYYLFTVFIITSLYGCPPIDNDWYVSYRNESDQDIFICSKIEQEGGECPDTLLPKEKIGRIFKKGTAKYFFPFDPPTCDIMRFFILSLDTVEKYDWETIRKEYKILKRYDVVGEKGLDQMGGVITYP